MNTEAQTLADILALSHEYGQGEDWVIAGGGNSSVKDEQHMWIKASGSALRTIREDQFVKMNREQLQRIWSAEYSEDTDLREQQALADLLAAREEGQGELRPSVETMMHALFPHRLVLHTHPTMLNGLTCSRDGETAVRRLLGDRAIWIPTINPGFILSRRVHDEVEQWRSRNDGAWPQILVMQNHGLVVAAETAGEIRALQTEIADLVAKEVTTVPRMEPLQDNPSALEEIRDSVTQGIADYMAAQGNPLQPPHTISFTLPELLHRSADFQAFQPLVGALSPDHIVYSGHRPCFVSLPEPVGTATPAGALHAAIIAGIIDYCHDEDVCPKIVVVQGAGAVAAGTNETKAAMARLLFLNALKVCRYAESFGGVQPMPEDQVAFIRGWEVERFREQQSTG